MAFSATTALFGLLLVTAVLGALVGGCVVRLALYRRLQRDYDRWRLGLRKEIGSLVRAQENRQSLQAKLNRQTQHITSLETQLSRLEIDRSRQVRPATGSAVAAVDDGTTEPDDDNVPVLTRRVELGRQTSRGRKMTTS